MRSAFKPNVAMLGPTQPIPFNGVCLLASLAGLLLVATPGLAESDAKTWSTADQFREATASSRHVTVEATHPIGGRFDLLGNGALLLSKKARNKPFFESTDFYSTGRWSSCWFALDKDATPKAVQTTLWAYGQKQAMDMGWTKFAGNPLVCGNGSKLASDRSLQLPGPRGAEPNDQALVRGAGKWKDQWLLIFNHGSWAKHGWGAVVADSLAPLKRGENPFQVIKPFPLVTAEERGGKHAPNDWIYVNQTNTWYAPDETGGGPSHMWTSENLIDWSNQGPIKNMLGHDPGMVWDGSRFHLFNEKSPAIAHMVSEDPLGEWEATGAALEVGGHTGDADVSFFNNRWHMFFDDHPHGRYKLGYAWTTPEKFPRGWRLTHHVYGPRNPDQGQQWDEPDGSGNNFGTGDADVALEGDTLYLTHERPIGLAHKSLNVRSGKNQKAQLRLLGDTNGDGERELTTDWLTIQPGKQQISVPKAFAQQRPDRVRIEFKFQTHKSSVSPMIRHLKLIFD